MCPIFPCASQFLGTIPATPKNITVAFLTPTTVRVSWQTMIDLKAHPVDKYIVTYKPTDDRYVLLHYLLPALPPTLFDLLARHNSPYGLN